MIPAAVPAFSWTRGFCAGGICAWGAGKIRAGLTKIIYLVLAPIYFSPIKVNPVCADDILNELQAALPFKADPELLEEIVTMSCAIQFVGKGEVMFKPGDPAKGFYWLLSGTARMRIRQDAPLELSRGFMVGLDSFLLRQRHPFAIETGPGGARTLFVNRVSYAHFSEHKGFHKLINKQILYHLDAYRSRLAAPTAAGFSDQRQDPYRLR